MSIEPKIGREIVYIESDEISPEELKAREEEIEYLITNAVSFDGIENPITYQHDYHTRWGGYWICKKCKTAFERLAPYYKTPCDEDHSQPKKKPNIIYVIGPNEEINIETPIPYKKIRTIRNELHDQDLDRRAKSFWS